MKTIYFVRHGQSQANVDKIFAGSRVDSPLTSQGLEQADLTAKALRGKQFNLIVSSPLIRAKMTAERIAVKLGYTGEILLEPLLTERDFGAASGKLWDEVGGKVDDENVDGLETAAQLASRIQKILHWFHEVPGEHILVVGHGTVEAMLYTVYSNKPYDTFLNAKELGNAEIREYTIEAAS